MKKRIVMMMGAVLAAGVACGADVSATADFASAYIFRGVTLNDGLVFQPGAKISGFPIPEEYGSVAVGTWANFDINDIGGGREFSEVDYYATYALPIKAVDLSTTYTEYTYPQGASADREVALAVGKAIGESGLYPSLTVNYGLYGLVEKNWYIQGGLDYTKKLMEALTLSTGVKVAYLVSDAGKDGFNDATAKVGLSYALTENWAVNSSLNYVAQLDDEVLVDAVGAYDKEAFAMLGLSCNF